MTVALAIRPAEQRGRAVPGLFGRKGVEVVNESDEPIRDVVVAGLGRPFIGVALLGSPIPLLQPGESVPYLFERAPAKAAQWVFRVSGELPDGTLFAVNLPYRP